MASIDDILQDLPVTMPLEGCWEGLDPALDNSLYPPTRWPDIENVRVARGLIETRLGMTLYKALPGSGDVRLLADFYTDTPARFRLAARGTGAAAAFYDLEEGVDSVFQTTTGGTGLGGTVEPYFQGVIQNNRFYFTDRFGVFRRYEPAPSSGNQVRQIQQPVAPAIAPIITPRTYRILDEWPGADPFGWTESAAADFEVQEDTAITPPPGDGKAIRLKINNSGAVGDTISKNVSAEVLNSNTIAFWLRVGSTRVAIQFQYGLGSPTDYTYPLKATKLHTWLPAFVQVGGLPTINFKRFKCVDTFDNDVYKVSTLYLPGRLEGEYRWVYTHYDSTTGRESQPSPVSNTGSPLSFSLAGKDNEPTTASAFQRSAAITVTSDSGTDASTNKIRIYRNGGTPALTVDSRGKAVWFRVGQINDQPATPMTLTGSPGAGTTVIALSDVSTIAVGDFIVIDKGVVGSEEFVTVIAVGVTTITVREGLLYAHSPGQSAQIAFLDNVPNEQVDVTATVDLARNDPPSGTKFVGRSPDGRLWLFGNTTKRTQVCVSNRSTPERPEDYEVFPDNIDPLTNKNPIQGWRFEIGGDSNDEEILWGGFYRDLATILTRRNLYVVNAASQLDWGPLAVNKVSSTGCIAGDTVQEVNGVLYWVADGPRIVRWNGQGAPEVISHQRVNVRLNNAPTNLWIQWFAEYHAKRDGPYYNLYFTPSGATTNTQRLDFAVDQNAWEPTVYYAGGGTAIAWRQSSVRAGGTDVSELYQCATDGNIYQAETGLTDDGVAIKIRAKTKRFPIGAIGLLQQCFIRLAAVTDSLTLTVYSGGSEYGDITKNYTIDLSGSGDKEIKARLERDLQGRWCQIQLSGDVSNRPAIREIMLWYYIHRLSRASASGSIG